MKEDIRDYPTTGAAPSLQNSWIIEAALFGNVAVIDIDSFLKLLNEDCTAYGTEANASQQPIGIRGGCWTTGTLGASASYKYEITGPNFTATVNYSSKPNRTVDSLSIRPKSGESITIQGRQIKSSQAGELLRLCAEITARTLAARNAEQQQKFDNVISAITAA